VPWPSLIIPLGTLLVIPLGTLLVIVICARTPVAVLLPLLRLLRSLLLALLGWSGLLVLLLRLSLLLTLVLLLRLSLLLTLGLLLRLVLLLRLPGLLGLLLRLTLLLVLLLRLSLLRWPGLLSLRLLRPWLLTLGPPFGPLTLRLLLLPLVWIPWLLWLFLLFLRLTGPFRGLGPLLLAAAVLLPVCDRAFRPACFACLGCVNCLLVKDLVYKILLFEEFNPLNFELLSYFPQFGNKHLAQFKNIMHVVDCVEKLISIVFGEAGNEAIPPTE